VSWGTAVRASPSGVKLFLIQRASAAIYAALRLASFRARSTISIGALQGRQVLRNQVLSLASRPNSAIDSDTYSAPLCAPIGARHRGRWASY
jgi:hypothetical protein